MHFENETICCNFKSTVNYNEISMLESYIIIVRQTIADGTEE